MKPRLSHGKPCPGHFFMPLLYGFIVILLANYVPGTFVRAARAAELQGSGWTVQQQGDSGTAQPAGQAQQAPAGQVQQQPEQLGDIQEEVPTFLEPESIPDSVPVPMADWVFEVPVDVKNLPGEVRDLMVYCLVMEGNKNDRNVLLGSGKKIVQPVNGAYQGTILVGVNISQDSQDEGWSVHHADRCTCGLQLRGPDPGSGYIWVSPGISMSPPWRNADPNEPYRRVWHMEFH